MSWFVLVVGYLVLLMAFGFAINRLMAPLFGRGWRLFVAPGIVVHELAHALACVLVGAPIHEINFWKASGGHVIHGPARFHLIGPVLIAFAPLIVMTVGLFFLAPYFSQGIEDLGWTRDVPESFLGAIRGYAGAIIATARSFDWLTPVPWLLLYSMLNVAVTIAPSTIDLANGLWPFVALVIIALGLAAFWELTLPIGAVWPPIATSLVLLGITLIGAVVVRLMVGRLRSF